MEELCSSEQHGITTQKSTLREPQLQHEIPEAVPQHFLTYLLTYFRLYGPPKTFASLTTGVKSSLMRHMSVGLLPYTILRGETEEPGATLRLAPAC